MGVRDYDSKLSQFLTPDPLYFENLEKCQSSPLQCSLYGYAIGNPVTFVDPSGTDGFNPVSPLGPIWPPTTAVPPPSTPPTPAPRSLPAPTVPGVSPMAVGVGVALAILLTPSSLGDGSCNAPTACGKGTERRQGPKLRVNLDTSALVSATQLSNPSVAVGLRAYLGDKDVVVTRTAMQEFANGSFRFAGPRERIAVALFMTRLTLIEDNPSERVMNIPIVSNKDIKRLGLNDRIIFGTGDRDGIPTVTCDVSFVNAVWSKARIRISHVPFPDATYSGR